MAENNKLSAFIDRTQEFRLIVDQLRSSKPELAKLTLFPERRELSTFYSQANQIVNPNS